MKNNIITKVIIMITFVVIMNNCSDENLPADYLKKTNKPTFNNPYVWIGEGHNWIMDKFYCKEVEFSLENSFELTKQFMRIKGMEYNEFANSRILNKTEELLKLSFPGFPNSIDNSKREMSLEEIVSLLFNENLISEKTK